MGDYAQAARYYDLLYAGMKDYEEESRDIAGMIRETVPGARRVLDVGCGTGRHAECLTALGFAVDGVDLEPAFVDIAAARCPNGSFQVGDMRRLALGRRYDAIVCLFSAIGYVLTLDALAETLASMAEHLEPGGVIIIEAWFEPGQLTNHWISATTGAADDVSVCRMSRTTINGTISTLEFEYLIGTRDGIERRSERHSLGLFTREQMEAAFVSAGLSVEQRRGAPRHRGVYIGRLAGPLVLSP